MGSGYVWETFAVGDEEAWRRASTSGFGGPVRISVGVPCLALCLTYIAKNKQAG